VGLAGELHSVFECSRYSLPGFDCIVLCPNRDPQSTPVDISQLRKEEVFVVEKAFNTRVQVSQKEQSTKCVILNICNAGRMIGVLIDTKFHILIFHQYYAEPNIGDISIFLVIFCILLVIQQFLF
jgi:hypothetical protein